RAGAPFSSHLLFLKGRAFRSRSAWRGVPLTARVITRCNPKSNGYPALHPPYFLRERVAGLAFTARVITRCNLKSNGYPALHPPLIWVQGVAARLPPTARVRRSLHPPRPGTNES